MGALPAAATAAWAVDGELACWAAKGGVQWCGAAGAGAVIKIPRGLEVHALGLRDGVLFVGGAGPRGEVLGSVDLRATRPVYAALPVPAELRSHGKSIDGFVFDGDRLLALDDFLDPKWFLRYDVSEPRRPRYLEARPLDPHSTGHVVHAAALAGRHVAVVSTSYNHGRASVRLELFTRGGLQPRAQVSDRAWTPQWGKPDAGGREFVHVDALGERLLVADGREGLAFAELRVVDPEVAVAGREFVFDAACSARLEAGLQWLRFPGLAVVRAFLIDEDRAMVSLRDEQGAHQLRDVQLTRG